MRFFIPGKPFGKPRPRCRVIFRNKKAVATMYPCPKGKVYEAHVASCFQNQCQDFTPFLKGLPLYCRMVAIFEPAPSWSDSKKKDAIDGYILPTKKPDADNISKAVLDGLNKFAFYDDRQIIALDIVKVYGETEGIEVELLVQGGL